VNTTKETNMSIFGDILRKIFPAQHPAVVNAPTPAAPAPSAAAGKAPGSPTSPPPSGPPAAASAPGSVGTVPVQAPIAAPPTPQAAPPVDVEAVLAAMAQKNPQQLNWRSSIVDLMKLLDLDSSLAARQSLAKELGYTGDMHDSASMNIWLHKQVMTKLAENGGKVPADLRH
jgi:hypothetical protein